MLGSDLLEMLEGACGRALGDSELQSIAVVEVRDLQEFNTNMLHGNVDCFICFQIHASKPSYEVGTSTQLSFANRLPGRRLEAIGVGFLLVSLVRSEASKNI